MKVIELTITGIGYILVALLWGLVSLGVWLEEHKIIMRNERKNI